MSMFPSIDIAGSGLGVDQTWIDTISGNVANANDAVTPGQPVYRDQEIVAEESPSAIGPGTSAAGNGVQVQSIQLGSAKGVISYDPSNPIANKAGDVLTPDINIGHEMTSL